MAAQIVSLDQHGNQLAGFSGAGHDLVMAILNERALHREVVAIG